MFASSAAESPRRLHPVKPVTCRWAIDEVDRKLQTWDICNGAPTRQIGRGIEFPVVGLQRQPRRHRQFYGICRRKIRALLQDLPTDRTDLVVRRSVRLPRFGFLSARRLAFWSCRRWLSGGGLGSVGLGRCRCGFRRGLLVNHLAHLVELFVDSGFSPIKTLLAQVNRVGKQ